MAERPSVTNPYSFSFDKSVVPLCGATDSFYRWLLLEEMGDKKVYIYYVYIYSINETKKWLEGAKTYLIWYRNGVDMV